MDTAASPSPDSVACSNDSIIAITELRGQIKILCETQNRQERDIISQEHRLFHAIANVKGAWNGPSEKFRAALGALSWCLTARLLRSSALAAAGGTAFAAAFFAWQANVLLDEQNRRIDLQTHLMESQRRAGLIFEISSILDQVEKEKEVYAKSHPKIEETRKNQDDRFLEQRLALGNREAKFRQSTALSGRIAALSLSLRPYYYLSYQNSAGLPSFDSKTVNPIDKVLFFISALSLRRPPFNALPYLNVRPLSPERGQLLLTLSASGVSFSNLASRGATFADADLSDRLISGNFYAANLTGSDFRRSKFYNANFSSEDLVPPQLDNADFTCASFYNTNLTNATLDGASFAFVKMAGLQISRIGKFGGTKQEVDPVHLARANLTDADFTDAIIDNPSLLTGDGAEKSGIDRNRWRLEPISEDRYAVRDSYTGDQLEVWQQRINNACGKK